MVKAKLILFDDELGDYCEFIFVGEFKSYYIYESTKTGRRKLVPKELVEQIVLGFFEFANISSPFLAVWGAVGYSPVAF